MKAFIRRGNSILLCSWFILAIGMSASADWVNPPHEQLAEQSDLVLLGEFIGRERVAGLLNEDSVSIVGVIRVESLFKGEAKRIVLLLLPPDRPNGLISSADVRIEDGQRGLWYLRKKTEGLYTLDKPYRFLNMDVAEPRIRELKKTH